MPKRKAKPETLLTAARICRGKLVEGDPCTPMQACALAWAAIVECGSANDWYSLPCRLKIFLGVNSFVAVADWNNYQYRHKSLIARKLNEYFRKYGLLGNLRAVLRRLPPVGKAVRDGK